MMNRSNLKLLVLLAMTSVIALFIAPSMITLAKSYYHIAQNYTTYSATRTLMHTLIITIAIYSFSEVIDDVLHTFINNSDRAF